MSADFAIGIKIGATTGAAIAGLSSIRRQMKNLGEETAKLTSRQRLLGNVLKDPLRLSKSRIGELKHEYDRLGQTLDKLRKKQAALGAVQLRRDNLAAHRQELKGKIVNTASWAGTAAVPIKLAIDFESSMADVKKVVDFDTPQQIKEMEQDILRLTRSIPMAVTKLTQIAASGGQLGIARKDIAGFTETIAKMSVAFDMPAEQAGDSMAKLANVYKIPIAQIGKLGDAINHLSNSSPAKASDIVNTLGRVGGVAKQFGLTELQTASLANAFISLGKTPEVAGTAVNGMLTKLMTADKQGKKFQAVLEGMGTDSKTLKKAIAENGERALMDFLKQIEKLPKESQMGALVDLFGLEYADDVAALVGGLDTYAKSVEALKKAGKGGSPEFMGSMEKEFAARSATTANNLQLLKNSLVELGISLGSALLPIVNQLVNAVKPWIYSLIQWTQANPELTKGLIGFVAGLAAVKVALLGVGFAFNLLATGFTFFPATLAKVSASWLLAALKFRSGSGVVFHALKWVKGGFSMLASAMPLIRAFGYGLIAGPLHMLKLFSSGLMSLIRFLPVVGSAFLRLGMFLMANPIGIALGLMAVAAYLLYTRWNDVVGGAKALWQDLCSFVGGIAAAVGQFFGNMWQSIQAFFSSGIVNISTQIINWSPLGLFYQAFASVMSWFGVTLPASFTQFGLNIMDGLWNGLKARFEAVKAWFADKAGWFKSVFAASNEIRSPSRVFKRFGGWMMEGLKIGLDGKAARPLSAVNRISDGLQRRFLGGTGSLSADLSARISGGSAEFSAARAAQAAPSGGITVNFNPTINAPGGDPNQIQTALQMGLREFEMMFHRMMADRERRAY